MIKVEVICFLAQQLIHVSLQDRIFGDALPLFDVIGASSASKYHTSKLLISAGAHKLPRASSMRLNERRRGSFS